MRLLCFSWLINDSGLLVHSPLPIVDRRYGYQPPTVPVYDMNLAIIVAIHIPCQQYSSISYPRVVLSAIKALCFIEIATMGWRARFGQLIG